MHSLKVSEVSMAYKIVALLKTLLIMLCLVAPIFSQFAIAKGNNAPGDQLRTEWCKSVKIEDIKESAYFPTLYEDVITIVTQYCDSKLSNFQLLKKITTMLDHLDTVLGHTDIPARLKADGRYLLDESGVVAQFEVLDDPSLAIQYVSPVYHRIGGQDLAKCDELAANMLSKKTQQNGHCLAALRDFEFNYNHAQAAYSQPIALEVAANLEALSKRWDRFYDESKSQMIWELVVNGMLFERNNTYEGFSEPPVWQLVFLHPTVVIQNVSEALDGSQLKGALMVEVIGADWWEQDRWYIPSGGSIVTTYSDRAGVQDWGYGVAINFDSQFTIGVTDHDGDIGYFITADLLKLLQGKKETLKSYLENETKFYE